MPIINGVEYTPEEAIAANYCPETGVDLTKVNPAAHRKSLWLAPPPLDDRGDEARRRMALYDKYLKDHPAPTEPPAKPQLSATRVK
jgi:hypothetical protein